MICSVMIETGFNVQNFTENALSANPYNEARRKSDCLFRIILPTLVELQVSSWENFFSLML